MFINEISGKADLIIIELIKNYLLPNYTNYVNIV